MIYDGIRIWLNERPFNDSKIATSNIWIKKVCEWCKKEFYSQKCTTRFCCKRCAEHAYKDHKRQKRKSYPEAQVQKSLHEKAQSEISLREYLSISEAAKLLGITRDGIYKLIYRGVLIAHRISSHFTVVFRKDIDSMIEARPYERKTKATTTTTDENGELSRNYTQQKSVSTASLSGI